MNDPVPAYIFGALLLLTGGAMLFSQRRLGSAADLASGPEEQAFLYRRSRRRAQVAGMILLVGVMIPLGDSLIPWQKAPATFAVYWLIVIGLAVWTGLLALGDMAATRAYMATELNRLHRTKLELHRVAQRSRKSEGHGPVEQ